MPIVIESTVEYALPQNCKLRVWRTETESGLMIHTDVKELADKFNTYRNTHSVKEFVEAVCQLQRVSAVQFINAHGNGFVVYTEWP